MSEFLDPLDTREVDDVNFMIVDHWFRYLSDVAKRLFTVPVGFVTDFESMIRWVPTLYALLGDANHEPAAVHDWLYYSQIVSRAMADEVFFEACGISVGGKPATPLWKRRLLWAGLRIGGWRAWNEHTKKGDPKNGKFADSPDIVNKK